MYGRTAKEFHNNNVHIQSIFLLKIKNFCTHFILQILKISNVFSIYIIKKVLEHCH